MNRIPFRSLLFPTAVLVTFTALTELSYSQTPKSGASSSSTTPKTQAPSSTTSNSASLVPPPDGTTPVAETAPIITQPIPTVSSGPTAEPTIIAPELQEPGVFYIHNQLAVPVQGKVEKITTAYAHRTFDSTAGTLVPGEIIEIIAIAPEGFLIRPLIRGNNFIGWIRKDQLPPGVDKDVLAQAEHLYQRQQDINVAIANKNVVQGMSPDEVQKAIGKPEKVFKQDAPQASFEIWTYTTYKQVPQNSYYLDGAGNPIAQTSYISVPIGSLTVNFDKGMVVAVQEVRTDPESPGTYQAPQAVAQADPPPQPTEPVADYSAPQYQGQPVVYGGDQSAVVSQGPVYYPVWGGYGYRGGVARRGGGTVIINNRGNSGTVIINNRSAVPATGSGTANGTLFRH